MNHRIITHLNAVHGTRACHCGLNVRNVVILPRSALWQLFAGKRPCCVNWRQFSGYFGINTQVNESMKLIYRCQKGGVTWLFYPMKVMRLVCTAPLRFSEPEESRRSSLKNMGAKWESGRRRT